jgi:hypothetical protein
MRRRDAEQRKEGGTGAALTRQNEKPLIQSRGTLFAGFPVTSVERLLVRSCIRASKVDQLPDLIQSIGSSHQECEPGGE